MSLLFFQGHRGGSLWRLLEPAAAISPGDTTLGATGIDLWQRLSSGYRLPGELAETARQ